MEALVALGLASNVVQFVDFGSKLFERIEEFSSAAGETPGKIQELASRLSFTLKTIKDLDQESLTSVENDHRTLEACTNHLKEHDRILANFAVAETKDGASKWQKGAQKVEKTWKAFKSVRADDNIEGLQKSLDRLLGLVSLQLQARTA